MKNGNEPIYPDPMRGAEQSYSNQSPYTLPIGLTKREYMCIKLGVAETQDEEFDEIIRKAERKRLAGLAMQGLLSNPKLVFGLTDENIPNVALASIQMADELLKQLEK